MEGIYKICTLLWKGVFPLVKAYFFHEIQSFFWPGMETQEGACMTTWDKARPVF